MIPSIDLLEGRAVKLVGGDPRKIVWESPDPVGFARELFTKGAKTLHVVDLDAALGRGRQKNASLLEDLLEMGRGDVLVGGGLRTTEDVARLISRGASGVVVGTRAVEDPSWVRELEGLFPERIVVALDSKGGRVLKEGWRSSTGRSPKEMARRVEECGARKILFTDVAHEGSLSGIDRRAILDLRRSTECELFVSGGISTLEDLQSLEKMGVDGAILGRALHSPTFDLEGAFQRWGEGP